MLYVFNGLFLFKNVFPNFTVTRIYLIHIEDTAARKKTALWELTSTKFLLSVHGLIFELNEQCGQQPKKATAMIESMEICKLH